jgi:hypothetical protein
MKVKKKSNSPKWRVGHENISPHADYFHHWRSGDRLALTQYYNGNISNPSPYHLIKDYESILLID